MGSVGTMTMRGARMLLAVLAMLCALAVGGSLLAAPGRAWAEAVTVSLDEAPGQPYELMGRWDPDEGLIEVWVRQSSGTESAGSQTRRLSKERWEGFVGDAYFGTKRSSAKRTVFYSRVWRGADELAGMGARIALPEDSSYLFSYFNGQIELQPGAVDASGVRDMSYMFSGAASANPEVSDWEVGGVTNMNSMFADAISADPNVSDWDVRNVEDMSYMFSGAASANPKVSDWEVRSVTSMYAMFREAVSADPNVSGWDVRNVESMAYMFHVATSANPEVSDWEVGSVTDMRGMFEGAASANPDVSGWDVRNVEDMAYMFSNAYEASPDISRWRWRDDVNLMGFFHMFEGSQVRTPGLGATGAQFERLAATASGDVDALRLDPARRYGFIRASDSIRPSGEHFAGDELSGDPILDDAARLFDRVAYRLTEFSKVTVTPRAATVEYGDPLPALAYDVSPAEARGGVAGSLAVEGYTRETPAGTSLPIAGGTLSLSPAFPGPYYFGGVDESAAQLRVLRKPVGVPALSPERIEYDGQRKRVPLQGGVDGTYSIEQGGYGTDAGDYSAVLRVDSNHRWDDGEPDPEGERTVAWRISRRPIVAKPAAARVAWDERPSWTGEPRVEGLPDGVAAAEVVEGRYLPAAPLPAGGAPYPLAGLEPGAYRLDGSGVRLVAAQAGNYDLSVQGGDLELLSAPDPAPGPAVGPDATPPTGDALPPLAAALALPLGAGALALAASRRRARR